MATTIISIGDRTVRIPTDRDACPQIAFERTLSRLYGKRAFIKPRYGEKWRSGGGEFHGYVDIYRSLGWNRGATKINDGQVWVSVVVEVPA